MLNKSLVKKALELGATRAFVVKPDKIPVNWKPVLLCLDCNVSKNNWMMRWSCPPYSPTPKRTSELLSEYKHALVVNLEFGFWPFTKHSYNSINPLVQLSQKLFSHFYWKKIHFIMLNLKEHLSQNYRVFSWGSSPCHACLKCSYPKKCKKPELFLFSPEASGINLYKIAKKVNIPIEIPPNNKVQLISLLLFN